MMTPGARHDPRRPRRRIALWQCAPPLIPLIFFFCDIILDPPGCEKQQGFAGATLGCAPDPAPGGPGVITVAGSTPADLDAAILAANAAAGPTTIVFPPGITISVSTPPKVLTASNVTILGYGATIRGDDLPPPPPEQPKCSATNPCPAPYNDCSPNGLCRVTCTTVADCPAIYNACGSNGFCICPNCSGALLEIQGSNVLVRDLHVRNGYDNVRIQGPNAHHVTISHCSSTGARDDGISASNRPGDPGAPHDITIQHNFLAGNTRSMFLKSNEPSQHVERVSVHHNWMLRQWVRGPMADGSRDVDLVNNVVEDWAEWGTKFDHGATGNLAYNVYRQSAYAVALGKLVDPTCRTSNYVCILNQAAEAAGLCEYDGNENKAFNFGEAGNPSDVWTGEGANHTNWYLGLARWAVDGTRKDALGQSNPWPMPAVDTLHYWGDVEYEVSTRTGPCNLSPTEIAAWQAGLPVVCPRHPVDRAYIDAQTWCVNEGTAFRIPGM